ncbi:MAG: CotH protein [Chthoniobacteraceae bacterium]|nr:CotH protein [Chthoniobacteraceae bacterium]
MKLPLFLLALLPLNAAFGEYNLNSAFIANELASGAISFPGPFGGTLSLGYNFTPATPSKFSTTGLVHTDNWANSPSMQGWYYANDFIVPALVVNTTSGTVTLPFANMAPGQMHLHPGNPSANGGALPAAAAVLRYTVPASGVYTISGDFQSLNAGTVAVDILRNGVSILANGAGSDATSFEEVETLAAGDLIDFVVDSAGDVGSDSTGLNANIAQGEPPPPPPPDFTIAESEPIGPATRRGAFVFSEIMYHPASRADGRNAEFIELYNSQPWAEDLSGYRITGEVAYDFPPGTTIPALGRLVIAAVPADVGTIYGITGVLGPWMGALNNGGGKLNLRNEGGGIVFEVDYQSDNEWPAAPDGGGPSLVLSRPTLGMRNAAAWAMSVQAGGSPGAAEPQLENPWRGVLINEVLAHLLNGDFIELYNTGATAVDLTGCILSDHPDLPKYVFPAGASIPAKGFLALNETGLGFAPHAAGDTIYLKAPQGARVLDAVRFGAQEMAVSSGRTPDGAKQWSTLTAATPGGANSAPRRGDVVISEIMYHPITTLAADEFIELQNRTAAALDMSGWRMRGEADFNFPPGTTIAAGGRIVLAQNPSHLIAAYAGLTKENTLGPFSGSLSDRSGNLVLQKPVAYTPAGGPTQTLNVEVDALTYGTGGRWGKWSDGGGSSLELIDARADGRLAASWADSDSSAVSDWKTIELTGVLDNGMGAAPANQLQLFLLGKGECLVDDVEIIRSGGTNLITNGAFSSGAAGWTFQGTQETSTVENGALHLRATDRGDTSNRVFTPLTATIPAGTTATIRAKVKWLRGSPEILLRLRGSWLEASGYILTSGALGTPGAPNSRAATNSGPAISEVTHRPILPHGGQPVVVYARVSDPDPLNGVQLQYRIDPGATLASVAMAPIGGGLFSAQIPAQTSGVLAAFRVVAADTAGASATFPDDAPVRECLVRWGDRVPTGDFGVYRMWMTKATADRWAVREKNSNAPLDITFVYGGDRVIYNATAQYSGSWAHTPGFSGPTGAPCDYTLNFPTDDPLLGETAGILALPGSVGDDAAFQREQLAWWIARKLGVPAIHRRFVRVFVNGQQRQSVLEDTQQPGGEFLKEWFPNNDQGVMHKSQDWVEFQDNAMSALGDVRATLGNFTTTGGVKKTARYRWLWAPRAGDVLDNNFADFFALVAAHNEPNGTAYQTQVSTLVDIDSWMRAMALQRIAGNWDSYGWSIGKNMYVYKPPAGRWAMIPWDIDFSFGQVGDSATSNLFTNTSEHVGNESLADSLMLKFRNNITFRRSYWRAFSDAVNGPLLAANARIDLIHNALLAQGVNATGVQGVKDYVAARRNYILSQLATVASGFTVTGPTSFSTDTGTITLSGTAPIGTKSITAKGTELGVVWSSVNAWSATYLLAPGDNTIVINALGTSGNLLGSTTLTIHYTGTATWPALRINEWMATNSSYPDPADGHADDWFEIYNPTGTPVNLANWQLSDQSGLPSQFIVPNGYTIPAGGRLLVWADNEALENSAGNPELHANFKLAGGGEALVLSAPDGTLIDSVVFGPQTEDRTEGRFPDGGAMIRALSLPTPGRSNALTQLTEFTRETAKVSITFTTTPGLRYRVEVSSDLLTWAPVGNEEVATNSTLTVVESNPPGNRRFYRILLSP